MNVNTRKQKEMNPAELAALFSNLKLIYHSGISLDEGLDILIKNADTDELRVRLINLRELCAKGTVFSEAMSKMGGIPVYAISLMTIATETGRMDATMENLQQYYEKRDALSQNIRSAIVYPMSMLFMVVLVIIALLTKVMPVFDQVFSQLGFKMTGLAGALKGAGSVLNQYAAIFCAILIFMVVAIILIRATAPGRSFILRQFETSALTKNLAAKLSLQRFALAMSGMLSSGIDWNQAMELSEPLITNRSVTLRIKDIRGAINQGISFQSALKGSGLFPGRAMVLLAMGIQTGTASDAFQMIGESITVETESRINRLISAIEPALVCIMCLLVGMVLLSVMLPIIGILTSM